MSSDPQRDLQVVNQMQDAFMRRSLKTALHLRRYFPIYVFLAVAVIAVSLAPSVQDDGEERRTLAGGDVEVGEQGGATDTTGPAIAAVDGAIASGGGPATQRVSRSIAQSLAAAQQTGGKTRGGIDCKPGVRQIPSRYAAPCTVAFTGDNGGAPTYGVLPDKIRIVRRGFADSANSRAVEAVVNQAGGAPAEYVRMVRDVFIKYFDQVFEHYGRKIEWIDYESRYGDSTDEALSQGREGACADATHIKDTLKAFAVVPGRNTASVSDVFASCAAERNMMSFGAAPYFPETWYRQHHPWAWGGVMECERISYQVAEYIGKRLARKPARWAGDPVIQRTPRKFGIYVPDNDAYQSCVRITRRTARDKYNVPDNAEQFNYQLDVSRFAQQAGEAIVQFRRRGVTTIVLACDPISTIFLTQAAARQGYYPEWLSIGVALHDVDNVGRLFDQTAVDGHLFGPSQLGSTKKLIGKESEPALLYRQLTGKELTEGGATDGNYWGLLGLYSLLQAAGPLLTPDSIAAGVFSLPPGGHPDYPVGYTSYRDGPDGTPGGRDHTAIDDSREIYWMGTARSEFDGRAGTYFETYGGKRFRNGEWPAEDPPIYPGR